MGRKEHEKELQTGKEGVADRGKEKDADRESPAVIAAATRAPALPRASAVPGWMRRSGLRPLVRVGGTKCRCGGLGAHLPPARGPGVAAAGAGMSGW